MPPVKEVLGTLLSSFKQNYPTTYAINDGSEMFTETPSDLHMQSSTWSAFSPQYGEIFVSLYVHQMDPFCTYSVSPVYVGSISDIELTHECGFLSKLEDKPVY